VTTSVLAGVSRVFGEGIFGVCVLEDGADVEEAEAACGFDVGGSFVGTLFCEGCGVVAGDTEVKLEDTEKVEGLVELT